MPVGKERATIAGIACFAVVALGVLLFASPSFASHSSAPKSGTTHHNASASKPNIAFVCALPSLAPFYSPMESGAKEAAAALGVNLSYTGLTTTVTNAAMVQVLQAAVNTKPDAIIACNYFPSGEDPILKAASAKGVPVFLT